MRAFAIEAYKKEPTFIERPVPKVGNNEVLVKIHAASINPLDTKIRKGELKLLLHYDMPLTLGNDFAGTIIEVGKDVTKFSVGDEVYGRPRSNKIGTFAEYLSVHEDDIAIKPKNLSFEEAASIPLVGLTSYQALYDILKVKNNQKILIHAGSGGVGTFAIQLAKEMGAYVATTASEGSNLAKSLGADEVINYKTENFEDIIKNYDAVIDTIGGSTLEKSFLTIKKGGKIVSISGTPNGRFAKEMGLGHFKKMLLSLASAKLTSLEKKHDVEYTFLFMKHSGQQLQVLTELLESRKIKPTIDKIFTFEEATKAMNYVETGKSKGKVILTIVGQQNNSKELITLA
ncbi:NADPH:quinone reductase [Lysinibacillus contaminans]|uniref:NADPH:quinone reductase n=1 Tax=Lysinibacillus contaminans TaxID=1293441 RepID=A0ABR5K3N8_9BACI|nr:NADP-dependent oxidoreductase [Lysinibacillus contaminans]KOS68969.1 NADPH:quinone reductase [Lysinibacillus contaminans]